MAALENRELDMQNYLAEVQNSGLGFNQPIDITPLVKVIKDRAADNSFISTFRLLDTICQSPLNYLMFFDQNLIGQLINGLNQLIDLMGNEIFVRDLEERYFLQNQVQNQVQPQVNENHLARRNQVFDYVNQLINNRDQINGHVQRGESIPLNVLSELYNGLIQIFRFYQNSYHLGYDPEVQQIQQQNIRPFRNCLLEQTKLTVEQFFKDFNQNPIEQLLNEDLNLIIRILDMLRMYQQYRTPFEPIEEGEFLSNEKLEIENYLNYLQNNISILDQYQYQSYISVESIEDLLNRIDEISRFLGTALDSQDFNFKGERYRALF